MNMHEICGIKVLEFLPVGKGSKDIHKKQDTFLGLLMPLQPCDSAIYMGHLRESGVEFLCLRFSIINKSVFPISRLHTFTRSFLPFVSFLPVNSGPLKQL